MFAACNSFTAEPGTTPDDASDGGADDTFVGDVVSEASADAADEEASLPSEDGCSDGTREGYVGASSLAACDGYWTVPGITTTTTPSCGRKSGNSGSNASGNGCSASDLCAAGWSVCADHLAVAVAKQGGDAGGPCEAAMNPAGALFYATAQPSNGATQCTADGGADDVFGCGDLAFIPSPASCLPLNALVASNELPKGWLVGGDPATERTTVVHAYGQGGVLCCKD